MPNKNADDDSEGSDDEPPSETPRKREGRGRGRGKARGRGAPQAAPTRKNKVMKAAPIKSKPPKKRKKGTPGCNTPKGPKPKPADVKAWLAKVRVALPYKGVQKGPVHFKSVTIYTCKPKHSWRVKPGIGRRDEKIVVYATDKRLAWSTVQERAAEYLAANPS